MMSSTNATDALVAEILTIAIPPDFLSVSAAQLYLFDYAITFSQEVQLIWPKITTGPSILYIANRAFALLFVLAQVLTQPNWTTVLGCRFSLILSRIPPTLLYVAWSLFSTLRVFSIARGAWPISVLVFLVSMIPTAYSLYDDAHASGFSVFIVSDSESLCVGDTSMSVANENQERYITACAFVAADLLVLAVTGWKTYSIRKDAMSVGIKTPLATTLLRNGTMYFLGLLLLNVAQIALWASDADFDLSGIIQMFTSIALARFLLDLRGVAAHPPGYMEDLSEIHVATQHFSDVRFVSKIVGNMGADLDDSLATGTLDSYDEGDEECDKQEDGEESQEMTVMTQAP